MRIKNNGNVEYKKILIVGTLEPEANFLLIPAIRLIREKIRIQRSILLQAVVQKKFSLILGGLKKSFHIKKRPY